MLNLSHAINIIDWKNKKKADNEEVKPEARPAAKVVNTLHAPPL